MLSYEIKRNRISLLTYKLSKQVFWSQDLTNFRAVIDCPLDQNFHKCDHGIRLVKEAKLWRYFFCSIFRYKCTEKKDSDILTFPSKTFWSFCEDGTKRKIPSEILQPLIVWVRICSKCWDHQTQQPLKTESWTMHSEFSDFCSLSRLY